MKMTKEQVKSAVECGCKVSFNNDSYIVIIDSADQLLIKCTFNNAVFNFSTYADADFTVID